MVDTRFTRMDDDVTAELEGLFKQGYALTPATVLEFAKDPSTAAHSHFTWEDTEAANLWRLEQASRLIIRCRIQVEVAPERTINVRRFVHDSTSRTYRPTEVVLTGPGRDELFARCLRDIQAVQRRYMDLVDFEAVLRAAGGQEAA